jgi:hypothetical protein
MFFLNTWQSLMAEENVSEKRPLNSYHSFEIPIWARRAHMSLRREHNYYNTSL